MVERYHAPLRSAFKKIRRDMGSDDRNSDCLQMAVFFVNCTVGPEGLCPMLLVFGEIRRPARCTPSSMQIERIKSIDAEMREVERELANRTINFGLRHSGVGKVN